MGLDSWLKRIEGLHPKSWDLGLDRVAEVGRRLNILKPAPLTFLVGGTNGKGSTCATIAALSAWQGYSVGITTSPHLIRFNERIVVDGVAASDAEICDSFAAIERAREDISLTYFEFGALAAMRIFCRRQVDVAVLEIGLGGRLDAMNIIDPDVSVVTRIALDHQSWLGNDRESIAREKAGIMRRGRPCVIADRQPPTSLEICARELGAKPRWIGRDFDTAEGRIQATGPGGENLNYALSGETRLPVESLAAGIQAMCDARRVPEPDHVSRLTNLAVPGRFQQIDAPRRTIFDVAHNPDAAAWLAARLAGVNARRVHAVVGMYRDKDYTRVLKTLAPRVDAWYVTRADESRAADVDELADVLAGCGGFVAGRYVKVSTAYDQAARGADADDLILVFGSFPVVGGVLEHLRVPV